MAEALLGKAFISNKGEVPLDKVIKAEVLAVYFGAHWIPPCKIFSEKLIDMYHKFNESSNAGKQFQVIFASKERNVEEFKTYFDAMPWVALKLDDTERFMHMGKELYVDEYPTLCIINKQGQLITAEGVIHLKEQGYAVLDYWKERIANNDCSDYEDSGDESDSDEEEKKAPKKDAKPGLKTELAKKEAGKGDPKKPEPRKDVAKPDPKDAAKPDPKDAAKPDPTKPEKPNDKDK